MRFDICTSFNIVTSNSKNSTIQSLCMDFEIPLHTTLELSFIVTETHSAAHLGSGSIAVLSTPSMLLFMEQTARMHAEQYLPEHLSTVGIEVNITHKKAVKIGEQVLATAELLEQDRKQLIYKIKVMHNSDIVGEGTHKRFIIDKEKFIQSI